MHVNKIAAKHFVHSKMRFSKVAHVQLVSINLVEQQSFVLKKYIHYINRVDMVILWLHCKTTFIIFLKMLR